MFCEIDGEPRQYVSEYNYEKVSVKEFSNREEFEAYANDFAVAPIDFDHSVMYRFEIVCVNGESGILVVLSHIIADAWTFSLLAKEVERAYQGLVSGEDISQYSKYDYTDFIKSEKEYFQSLKYQKDDAFWREKYAQKPENVSIKISTNSNASIKAKRYVRKLQVALTEAINSFCATTNITPAVLFETALSVYLSNINPENKTITLGVPVLNRSNVKEKNIAGMFISTMPLTIDVAKEDTVYQLAKQITMGHGNLFRHQKYPYSSILRNIREKYESSGNIYDVMVSFQNADTGTTFSTEWFSNGYSEVPFTLHIDNRDNGSSYTITADYQTDLFNVAGEVELIIDRLEHIIGQIIENVSMAVKDISIIPDDEKNNLLLKFNDTAVDYPKDKCVHELFTEQAKKTPDKIALVFEDKEFTYRELDEMSNSLALSLKGKGVSKGDRVAVLLNRDEKVIFMQFAVLKLGAVFIPIDSRYPKDRVEYILYESQAKLIVKNKSNSMMFNNSCDIEDLDFVNLKYENLNLDYKIICENVNFDDTCYIIFTSGSTGKPKGCMLTNRGLVNFCKNNNILSTCNKLEKQICVSVNTISFDYFIAESLLPLLNGYTVVLANEEESMDKELFRILAIKTNANIIQTTPTRYKLYFDENCDNSFVNQFDVYVTSGEALPLELLKIFCSNKNAKIFNPLGPSECSVWVAGGELKLNNSKVTAANITIGKPIANTQIYILDQNRQLLPIGVAGELCIAGDGVGKGYLNRPEITAERFIDNPFATEENGHGKIMYRTGDLARWRADAEIEYLGRIDTQVKIRGLRIELGEIESVMSGFAGIGMTAVTDKKDENGRQFLVGYYTSEHEIDKKELRQHLSAKLPKYMVPNYFVRLGSMPMTASGKTDRKNLPMPELTSQTNEYVAPKTEMERTLCTLLEELLEYEKIGIDDDFFELGGDSLKAIEYVAKAHTKGIELDLQNVFDYPTVRKLCEFMELGAKKRVSYEAVDFEKYSELLEKNVQDNTFVPKKASLGNVLLTGATGFLGAHVLDTLMKEEKGRIYCLIRSSSSNERNGRLSEILKYYFGDIYESELGNRIIPIVGDIEFDNLSDDIPNDVQTVIHTAATVKHYGSYEYFERVNVCGTKNVINYVKRVGAKLIHISTLSVSGNSLADDFSVYRSEEEKHFYESSFFIEQPLDNVYIHSKFEAERAVFDAMLEGVDAKIIRVGNLTNRVTDYRFQPNYRQNAFLTRVKALLEFGLCPDYLMSLYAEFSPIDMTAQGVVKIAQYAKEQTVFHLNSNRPIYFERFFELLKILNIPMKIVDSATFNEALFNTVKQSATEYIYEAFQNDMDEQGRLIYDSNIRIDNDFTLWFLKLVGFEWNETDYEYIRGYIEYFRELGYLEV